VAPDLVASPVLGVDADVVLVSAMVPAAGHPEAGTVLEERQANTVVEVVAEEHQDGMAAVVVAGRPASMVAAVAVAGHPVRKVAAAGHPGNMAFDELVVAHRRGRVAAVDPDTDWMM
jgi:hypothetical protein